MLIPICPLWWILNSDNLVISYNRSIRRNIFCYCGICPNFSSLSNSDCPQNDCIRTQQSTAFYGCMTFSMQMIIPTAQNDSGHNCHIILNNSRIPNYDANRMRNTNILSDSCIWVYITRIDYSD